MNIAEVKPITIFAKKSDKNTGKQRSIKCFIGIRLTFDDVDQRLDGRPCVNAKGHKSEPVGHTIFWSATYGTYSLTEPTRPELDEATAPWCRISKRLRMEEAEPLTLNGAIVVKEKRVKGNPDTNVRFDVSKWFPCGDGTTWGQRAIAAIAAANEERLQETAEAAA